MENPEITRHIWASFTDFEMAAEAVAAFIDHGVPKDRIHLITERIPGGYITADSQMIRSRAESGVTTTTGADAAIGAAKGTGIGLGVGIVAGLTALAIPGFGLVLGGGALATALAGAGGTVAAGALAGAVTGFLKDQGAEDVVVQRISKGLIDGDVILNLNPDAETIQDQEIANIIQKYQGIELVAPLKVR